MLAWRGGGSDGSTRRPKLTTLATDKSARASTLFWRTEATYLSARPQICSSLSLLILKTDVLRSSRAG